MNIEPRLASDDLVFCVSTILERSLHDKLEAAAAGGFRGISLWASDRLAAHAEGLSDDDIAALLAERGLAPVGIDCLFGWAGKEYPPDMPALQISESAIIESAAALGAGWINLAHAFGERVDEGRASDNFARICARAREYGLLVNVEFIPWAGIPDLAAALRIVSRSGAANGRISLDSWHFFRSGGSVDDLAAIPPQLIGNVQFSDSLAEPAEDHWADTSDRRLPLQGEQPLVALARQLRLIGYTGPFGIECPSSDWAGLDAASVGTRCGDAMRALNAAVSGRGAAEG